MRPALRIYRRDGLEVADSGVAAAGANSNAPVSQC